MAFWPVKTAQTAGLNGMVMSRITTKQFQAPFASVGSPTDDMGDDIFYNIGTNPGGLAWLPDTTATGIGAVRTDTWRRNEAERDRFRRRICTPAPRKPARSSRTKRARPRPTGGAGPPREVGVAASNSASAAANATALVEIV